MIINSRFQIIGLCHVHWFQAPKRLWRSFTRLVQSRPSSQPHDTQPRNAPIYSLPQELLRSILEQLTSKKDQSALARTCRALLDLGCRVLYAHIHIRLYWPNSDLIVATLFHRPDLAKYIRSYSGPLSIDIWKRDPVGRMMKKLGSKPVKRKGAPEGYFPIIFKHATCIRELEVLTYWSGDVGEQTWATIGQMPLTKLVIHEGIRVMPLNTLLAARPSIRHLGLDGNTYPWDIDRLEGQDLPNLESLASPIGPAKLLVPGRPIQSVMIDFGNDTRADDELWLKLGQSSAGVVKLDLFPWSSSQLLEQVASYLPRIRHLRLRAHYYNPFEVCKSSLAPPSLKWTNQRVPTSVIGCPGSELFTRTEYSGSQHRKGVTPVGKPPLIVRRKYLRLGL